MAINIKKWWKKKSLFNKKLTVGIVTMSIFLLIIFGAKVYLYINFLLGNDTLIDLSVNKQQISLAGGESENVMFESKITANPFCEAVCNYEFQDISNNISLDKNNFTLKSGAPFSRQYNLKAKTLEAGQELYRFDIECSSKATALCSTNEQTVMRDVLVTLDYTLNEQDKKYVEDIKAELNNISDKLDFFEKKAIYYNESLSELQQKININANTNFLKNNTLQNHKRLEEIKQLWINQSYISVQQQIEQINLDLNSTEISSNQLNNSIISKLYQYNNLIDSLNQTDILLNEIKNYQLNETLIPELNSLINEFNNDLISFKKISPIDEKENLVSGIYNKTLVFFGKIKDFDKNSSNTHLVISEVNIDKIIPNENISSIKIIFDEPAEKCCVFGNCYKCCTTDKCKNSQENYPVIFLHGHQFNKNLPVEFNLDGFDKIQNKLETDNGYLNLGTISSYNENQIDSWGKIPVPFSIRLSYYYDTLQQSGNYIR